MKKDIKFESDIFAIWPEAIDRVINSRVDVTAEVDIEGAINRRATKFKEVKGDVVIVPVYGYISHKPSLYSALGLETSSQILAGWMEDLVSNASVGAIILDVDSPGGTVAGLSGVSDLIYSMRGQKPIIAVSNDLMASAAYFIASSADEIVADPDSLTGSIGTIAVHFDYSDYLEQLGIKTTIIKAGKHKSEGSPYRPLDDGAKESWQEMVNGYYETFVSAVARNRNVSSSVVKSDFGQGRVFRADEAKKVGMVDRIATLQNVLRDLRPTGRSKSRTRAELDLIIS